jgi:N utilization substance protein B
VATETRGSGSGPRRRARVASMKILYRVEVVGDDLEQLVSELAGSDTIPESAREYAIELLQKIGAHAAEIDGVLNAALTRWDLKRLAVIDRCVLRIGTAELLYEANVPTRVVLDEAIEIAKQFGSKESGRFVNGVLDHVARESRKEDMG